MTERLYYADPYLRRFEARALACVRGESGWEVTLDRTAFYPEGGGQPGDTGSLGPVRVLDTREREGEILHFCDGPLEPGAPLTGELDWARRFDHMQQHSGEHIASGLICAAHGCDNVGFHLGADTVTIDFNAPLSWEELTEIEGRANAVIWENRPFLVSHPGPETLETLPYRSKKALTGDVRLVECPGADLCACCGTHVKSAGEIGILKFLTLKPFREGVRVELLAGQRAYRYLSACFDQNRAVSGLTSARQLETAAAVERLQGELAQVKYRLVGAENRLFARIAGERAGAGDTLLYLPDLSPEALRRCCETVAAVCGGRCGVFSGADGDLKYALAQPGGDLRERVKAMNAALRGRGGGKPDFAQGSLQASWDQVEAFFGKNG